MIRDPLASLFWKWFVLPTGLTALLAMPVRADVAGDIAFTAFANVDLNALAHGQVLQARGGLIDFQRGITAQSLYIIDAAPSAVAAKLTSWNPGAHSELKVWLHKPLPPHPTVADFPELQTLPNNSSVSYLIDQTDKLDPANPALQVSKDEAQMIAGLRASGSNGRTLMATAWSQILTGRIAHFLSGNLGPESYAVSGGDIQPMTEIKSLLRSDVKVYARYHPLLANTPLYNSTKAVPASLYYESFDVEGGAALGTGALYQSQAQSHRAQPVDVTDTVASTPPATIGAPILSADIEYFVNYGIYASIELEQLSPVTINGKVETLVWRNDMVSTSNVAYLHGTERLASGMIMLQDVKQAIDAFRAEFR